MVVLYLASLTLIPPLQLCQEYRQRGSGLPDLFLWNPVKKQCMFSEGMYFLRYPRWICLTNTDLGTVKSENDRLSDKQRLWIHILSAAGVRVELCAAIAGNEKNINEGDAAIRYCA